MLFLGTHVIALHSSILTCYFAAISVPSRGHHFSKYTRVSRVFGYPLICVTPVTPLLPASAGFIVMFWWNSFCELVLHTYYGIFWFASSSATHSSIKQSLTGMSHPSGRSIVMLSPCFTRRIFSSHISQACHSYSICITLGAAAAAAKVRYFRSFSEVAVTTSSPTETADFSECS